MSEALVLAYRGLAIAVRCAEPAPLAWLEAFLGPAFERAAGPAAASVELVLDPDRHAALRAAARPTGAETSWTTRDQGQRRLPVLDAGGRRMLELRDGVLLLPQPDGAEVVAESDHRRARLTLMRVVRELATARALALGDVPLHGAAVVTGGGATVFVGPKGAGKTTLLVHALRNAGVAYLTNDRLFVEPGAGAVTARAMATIVRLRPGTLDGAEDKLDPPRFCALLGVPAVGAAPLARVVVVDPARLERGLTVTPLDPAGAASRVARDGLLAGGVQAELFATPTPPLAPRLAALCARVPCFGLAMGPGAYDPPSSDRIRSLIGL